MSDDEMIDDGLTMAERFERNSDLCGQLIEAHKAQRNETMSVPMTRERVKFIRKSNDIIALYGELQRELKALAAMRAAIDDQDDFV